MRALWNTLHLGWEETEPPSEEMALDFLPVEPPSPLGVISEATMMCGPIQNTFWVAIPADSRYG